MDIDDEIGNDNSWFPATLNESDGETDTDDDDIAPNQEHQARRQQNN